MDQFVVGGSARYAAVLREQMDGEMVVLKAKLVEAASEEYRRRIESEIAELHQKHKAALRELRAFLY
jgi:hypothetical protein